MSKEGGRGGNGQEIGTKGWTFTFQVRRVGELWGRSPGSKKQKQRKGTDRENPWKTNGINK